MTEKIRIARWRLNVPVEVEAVYDAAMVRHEAKVRYHGLGLEEAERAQSWADYMNAEQELDRVCRRAKEGR